MRALSTQATADLLDAIRGEPVTWAALPDARHSLSIELTETCRYNLTADVTDDGPFVSISLPTGPIHLVGSWTALSRFAAALQAEIAEGESNAAEADHDARHTYEISPGYEDIPDLSETWDFESVPGE